MVIGIGGRNEAPVLGAIGCLCSSHSLSPQHKTTRSLSLEAGAGNGEPALGGDPPGRGAACCPLLAHTLHAMRPSTFCNVSFYSFVYLVYVFLFFDIETQTVASDEASKQVPGMKHLPCPAGRGVASCALLAHTLHATLASYAE